MVAMKPGISSTLSPAQMSESHILISFAQEATARLLGNYLQQQNVKVEFLKIEGEYPFALQLQDQTQQQVATQLIDAFLQNPQASKYQESAWEHGKSVDVTLSKIPLSEYLSTLKLTPLTSLVLTVCIVLHVAAMFGMQIEIFNFMQFRPPSELANSHQWWRLISPAFIHFSPLHLVFNVLWWWVLGIKIEKALGTSSLLLILMVTAIVSNYGQFLMSGANFGGLSGVVYGVMGFVWWIGWLRPSWGLSFPKSMVGFMLIWLVLGYADVLWVSVANTAHTLGLVSGCVLAVIWSRARPN